MRITIEIPEEIGNQLQQNWQDLPQKLLETLALEAYRSRYYDFWENSTITKI